MRIETFEQLINFGAGRQFTVSKAHQRKARNRCEQFFFDDKSNQMIIGQQVKFSLGRIIIFGHLVERLKSFYVDNFGFSVVEEIVDQWIVLNAGQVEIAIHKIGQEFEPEDGKEFRVESNTKLVFHITNNLEGFRQRLVDKGVVVGDAKSFEGINSLFCEGEDPEGNIFQIEQRFGLKKPTHNKN